MTVERLSQPGHRRTPRSGGSVLRSAGPGWSFVFALLLFGLGVRDLGAAGPITEAHTVHDLPPAQAAQALPVHLRATVTYYQPGEINFFVADRSGGVFILAKHGYPFPIRTGDQVEVEGATAASFRTIVGEGARIHVVGHGPQVAARPASFLQLVSGELDCQRVAIRGRVRSATLENHGAETVAQLQVLTPGGIVQAYVQHFQQLKLADLIDAEIELSGVAGADFNETMQLMRPKLFSDNAGDLHVLKRPLLKPRDLPATDISRLMETRFVLDQSQRVRVRGAVTAFEPGNSLSIEHNGKSLLALTRQTGSLTLGSVVDVIGFADNHAYSAVLEDAQFFPTGLSEPVAPRPVSYAQAMHGDVSDSLVSMQGRVLSEMRGEFSNAVVIMADRHPVSVVLQIKGRAPLPILAPGTVVSVAGICRVTPAPWGKPLLFRLDLRGAGDLKVLARPSWWTSTRLLLAGCGLLAVTALTFAWVAVLRRRVGQQTRQIERSMRVERERSRLLERISSELPLAELLDEICSSMASLVPETRCSFTWGDSASPGNGPAPAFEAALTDARGGPAGAFLVLRDSREPLSAAHREILAAGASLANLAVHQRQLYDKLNYQSTHDQLTALPNRRLADLRLDEAIAKAVRTGARIGIAYIDVDHFKEVNDRHGHKTGDLYLQQIANRLARSIRDSDLLARIGGDEFLLVSAALGSVDDGESYTRRLGGCFDHEFILDGIRVRGSASIGLAVFPDHGATPEILKRHADAAMYHAKHDGRLHSGSAARLAVRPEMLPPPELPALPCATA